MPDKEDRRENIYNYYSTLDGDAMTVAKDCMDDYMKECCLELLEYMSKNNVKVSLNKSDFFYFKGEWITGKQLFENFL